eukprot:SAG11_NODE_8485_length_1009_cov_8.415385_2_plen_101_part_00
MDFGRAVRAAAAAAAEAAATEARGNGAAAMREAAAAAAVAVREAMNAGGSAMGAGQCEANDVRVGGQAENAVGRAVTAVGAEGREANTEAAGRRSLVVSG